VGIGNDSTIDLLLAPAMDKRRSETWSRFVTTSAQATHNFEETDFSLLEGWGAGWYVSSRTFTAGGRAWSIRLYPDGLKEDKATHASVLLCFVGGARVAGERRRGIRSPGPGHNHHAIAYI